jgi:hypothetical protein
MPGRQLGGEHTGAATQDQPHWMGESVTLSARWQKFENEVFAEKRLLASLKMSIDMQGSFKCRSHMLLSTEPKTEGLHDYSSTSTRKAGLGLLSKHQTGRATLWEGA